MDEMMPQFGAKFYDEINIKNIYVPVHFRAELKGPKRNDAI